jgi:hypothetical protein
LVSSKEEKSKIIVAQNLFIFVDITRRESLIQNAPLLIESTEDKILGEIFFKYYNKGSSSGNAQIRKLFYIYDFATDLLYISQLFF